MPSYDLTEIKLRQYAVNVFRLRRNYSKLRRNVAFSQNYNDSQKAAQIRVLLRREDEAIRRLARGMFNKTPAQIENFVGSGGIAAFRRY